MFDHIWDPGRDGVEDLQRICSHFHVGVTNLLTKNIHDLATQPMLRKFSWIRLDQGVENRRHAVLSNLPITRLALFKQSFDLVEFLWEN